MKKKWKSYLKKEKKKTPSFEEVMKVMLLIIVRSGIPLPREITI